MVTNNEEREIKHLQVTLPEAIAAEKATIEQRKCKEWFKPGLHMSRKDHKHMVANTFFKLSRYALVFT